MCHLLLTLPLLALPVFWLLPLGAALSVYGAVTGISAVIYWYAVQAMKRPVETGMEGMMGETGTVVEASGPELLVQIHNELWHGASAGAPLRNGDRVEVVGAELRTLKVRGIDPIENFFRGSPDRHSLPR
jgi:inner membrane protein